MGVVNKEGEVPIMRLLILPHLVPYMMFLGSETVFVVFFLVFFFFLDGWNYIMALFDLRGICLEVCELGD